MDHVALSSPLLLEIQKIGFLIASNLKLKIMKNAISAMKDIICKIITQNV
jgi:hypothetical protein